MRTRNEFLAVRNEDGGFYLCQAMQNIHRASRRIRIRWLTQHPNDEFTPDFYDHTGKHFIYNKKRNILNFVFMVFVCQISVTLIIRLPRILT